MAQYWLELAVLGVLTGALGSPPRANISRQAVPSPPAAAAPVDAVPTVHAVLVFPFENQSRMANLEWLSEGLAELTVDRLESDSRFAFTREDRLDALERMGLPSASQFSIATMIEIGKEIGADDVVFGTYTSDAKTISVTAHVLRLDPPQLSAAISAAGPIANLLPLHARLAGSLVCAIDPAACSGGAPPAAVISLNRPPSNLEAFETYIRAVTGPADDQRLRDLRDAARLEPDWDLPAFELGIEEFQRRDCESALVWLSRVPPDRPRGAEASFDAGVCHLLHNDASRAASSFQDVLDRGAAPAVSDPAAGATGAASLYVPPEARNNLGVALLRLGKFGDAADQFQRAARAAPDAPDYLFNLGIAQFLSGDAAAAAADLHGAQALAPDDAGIHSAIEQIAAQTSAAAPSPSVAPHKPASAQTSNPAAEWIARARISPRFDRASLRPGGPADSAAVGQQGNAGSQDALAMHLERGQQFLGSGDLDDAQRAFTEALLSAPYDAAAHRGLAEVYRRQGRPDDALRELGAAISNLNDAATHVEMAQLLIEMNRAGDARDQLHQALAIDPANPQAHQILDKLDASTETGGTP
jgi:tetratricopeptide (TPR) repeat protein/TolB-like protein